MGHGSKFVKRKKITYPITQNSTTSPEEMSNRQLFFDAMMSFTVDLNVINDALENGTIIKIVNHFYMH